MIDKTIEITILLNTLILLNVNRICGHGRLVDPPSRSSAWRFGFKAEPNYNDNELFCGGFNTQWKVNKGKCGICGDPFNGRKDNELPNGKYTKKLFITRTYKEEEIIKAKVELTANHNGFFVFKMCPTTNHKKEVTQKCLDRFQLEVLNSDSSDKYIVPSKKAEIFTIELKLPKGLTCNRCVFQWTYTSANNWGKCNNGSSAVGCGPQETFRGCADIKIVDQKWNTNDQINDVNDKIFSTELSTKMDENIDQNFESTKHFSFDDYYRPNIYTTFELTTSTALPILISTNKTMTENKCHSIGIWKQISTMDEWCMVNCAANYCPPTHCSCI